LYGNGAGMYGMDVECSNIRDAAREEYYILVMIDV
jgi:hypothetical protein